MKQSDLIRIAADWKAAHANKQCYRTPAMSMRDFARLSALLDT